LSELEELAEARVPTGDRTVDRLLAGGWGAEEAILVHGPKGSGKSRCCLRWASRAGGLVVSLEMSPAILRHTAASAGAELERLHVVDAIDRWQAAAEQCRARVVVFDSVSRLPEHAVDWVRSAIQWGRGRAVPLLFLSHENKRGQPSGPNAIQHDPDSVLRLENARGDGTARLVVKKRRLSPLGSCRVELVPGALERLKHRGQRRSPVVGGGGEEPAEESRSPDDSEGDGS
jgi:predicted ATP-dependent serine protease